MGLSRAERSKIMKEKDFDPSKISKINIDKVEPNDYNPKEENTPQYREVVRSLEINGLKQPIFVREVDGNNKYVIVDGQQRWTAAKELGYTEIYIYNLGKISDEEAKSLTIWMEVAVPFNEIQLAPIALELHRLDMQLPYTEDELNKFSEMLEFDFNDYAVEEPDFEQDSDNEMKTLNIKMTPEQFEIVENAIKTVTEGENVSEGRALELLCSSGLAGYPFDGTGDIKMENIDESDS